MTRLRLTLAQLMAVVLCVGLVLAALRNAEAILASAIYTLAFLALSVAPLNALARKGRTRMAWAGFAVFGWARLSVNQIQLPPLLTEWGCAYFLPYLYRLNPHYA